MNSFAKHKNLRLSPGRRFRFSPQSRSFAKKIYAMKKTGRIFTHTLLFYDLFGCCKSAAKILLSAFPAFFFSCTAAEPAAGPDCNSQIYILKKIKTTAGTLDLFFFNDDALKTLDSYQRFENAESGVLDGASRTGDKIVACIANLDADIGSWKDINTLQRLSERMCDLSDDSLERPVMTGLCRVRAGRDRRAELPLEPLMSQVRLRSLCCDFHARPYKDAVLEDVEVYLVNVNRTMSVFDDGTGTYPSSWLNLGGREDDAPQPFQIGRLSGTVFPDAVFACYPNAAEGESLGRPQTRLVVEATLNGERYWYPISLPAVGRNQQVLMDVTITRTGTSGPDIPADAGAVNCAMKVLPWNEMEGYEIRF